MLDIKNISKIVGRKLPSGYTIVNFQTGINWYHLVLQNIMGA